jgi:hypothetical protein
VLLHNAVAAHIATWAATCFEQPCCSCLGWPSLFVSATNQHARSGTLQHSYTVVCIMCPGFLSYCSRGGARQALSCECSLQVLQQFTAQHGVMLGTYMYCCALSGSRQFLNRGLVAGVVCTKLWELTAGVAASEHQAPSIGVSLLSALHLQAQDHLVAHRHLPGDGDAAA